MGSLYVPDPSVTIIECFKDIAGRTPYKSLGSLYEDNLSFTEYMMAAFSTALTVPLPFQYKAGEIVHHLLLVIKYALVEACAPLPAIVASSAVNNATGYCKLPFPFFVLTVNASFIFCQFILGLKVVNA